jgi:cell division protein YceG involved in septum cleavage
MWVDQEALVLVKGESKGPGGEKTRWVQSDFRRIEGGQEIPHKSEIYSNGKLVSTSRILSVRVNQRLSDNLFDPGRVDAQPSVDVQELMKELNLQGEG